MAIRRHDLAILRSLKACRSLSKRRDLLTRGGRPVQRLLREISYNLLKGNLKLTKAQLRKLRRHKRAIRLLASKGPSLRRRVQLEQKGGFLGALIGPVLAALSSSILS